MLYRGFLIRSAHSGGTHAAMEEWNASRQSVDCRCIYSENMVEFSRNISTYGGQSLWNQCCKICVMDFVECASNRASLLLPRSLLRLALGQAQQSLAWSIQSCSSRWLIPMPNKSWCSGAKFLLPALEPCRGL